MLVGITGFAGSGKDTAAQALIDRGFERRAYADPMRAGLLAINPWVLVTGREHIDLLIVKYGHLEARRQWNIYGNPDLSRFTTWRLSDLIEEFGWNDVKRIVDEVRRLLQQYGTEGGRDIHGEDCWVEATLRTFDNDKDYVITDVRFPNERDFIHVNGGIVIRILRDGAGPAGEHSSEQVLDDVDYGIFNNGSIEQLHQEIVTLVVRHYQHRNDGRISEIERMLNEQLVGDENRVAARYPTLSSAKEWARRYFDLEDDVEVQFIPFDDHETHIRLANEMQERLRVQQWDNLRAAARALVGAVESLTHEPIGPTEIDDEGTWERAARFYAARWPNGNGGIGGEREQEKIEATLARSESTDPRSGTKSDARGSTEAP